jgi:hypothetical protein
MEGLDDLEGYLGSAKILGTSTFTLQGAHPSFRVILEGGVTTLVKPANTAPSDGEAMVRYEVAGWLVARELGWTDLVSTTVLRHTDELPGGETTASFQVIWSEFDPDADISRFPDEELWKAAIFDTLVLHSDRSHNWGAVPTRGRDGLRLVDHGYAFRAWPGRPFSSRFEEEKRGEEIPDERRDELEAFLQEAERGDLADHLEDDVLEQLMERGRHMVKSGVLGLP